MEISVNGKTISVEESTTVLMLLASRELDPERVVVERNGDIVPGDAFGRTELTTGDKLEVLRFVGGG